MTREVDHLTENDHAGILTAMANVPMGLSAEDSLSALNASIQPFYGGKEGSYLFVARHIIRTATDAPWPEVFRMPAHALCQRARDVLSGAGVGDGTEAVPEKKTPAKKPKQAVVSTPATTPSPESSGGQMVPQAVKERVETLQNTRTEYIHSLAPDRKSEGFEQRLAALEGQVQDIKHRLNEVLDLIKESQHAIVSEVTEHHDESASETAFGAAQEGALIALDVLTDERAAHHTVHPHLMMDLFNRLWFEIRMSMLHKDYVPPKRLVGREEYENAELFPNEQIYGAAYLIDDGPASPMDAGIAILHGSAEQNPDAKPAKKKKDPVIKGEFTVEGGQETPEDPPKEKKGRKKGKKEPKKVVETGPRPEEASQTFHEAIDAGAYDELIEREPEQEEADGTYILF